MGSAAPGEQPAAHASAATLLAAHGYTLPAGVVTAVETSWALAAPELAELRRRPVPLAPGYIEPHHGLVWIAAGGRSPARSR